MKRAPVVNLRRYRIARQIEESARVRLFRLVLDLIKDGDEQAIKSQIANAESELYRLSKEEDAEES